MIGQTVGSYRVLQQISVGGMGTIYRAEHTLIGRIAAIKVLHPELTTNHDIVNRFFNEAKATTTIKHPGIVEIFDFGYMPSGHAYIVMEFLDGMTLAERMRTRGVMPEGEAAVYLRGVCSALAAAHAKGIIHRDLKPDNIFVVPDLESPVGERVKLLDFGIAKLTDVGLATTATKTGAVMGTPTYMSPEQCKGTGNVDHRADLYSIGCMFYELVAGRPPFVHSGAGELIGSHLLVQPDPVSAHARVTRDTEILIMQLLAKDPAQRIATARELVDRLTIIAQQYVGPRQLATPHDLIQPAPESIPYRGADEPTVAQPYTPGMFDTPVPALRMTAPMPTPAPPVPTPPPARHGQMTPAQPLPTQKPTTLSGAASQSVVLASRTQKRNRLIGIGVGIALVAIGALVTVAAMGGSDDHETHGASPIQHVPAPAPAPAPEIKPAPPAPPPAPVVTPPDAAVAEPPVVDAPPVVEPPAKKPAKKPAKPTKPTKPDDPLLETDL
ncbi:MAG TPA: serine/threonine-protein kinase [Kofleriaceae bacterium]|nr:serine/threonine-protein kinase [Kofleriaceae bacterium]